MVVNGSMRDEKQHSPAYSINEKMSIQMECFFFFIINKWLVSQQKQANIKPAKNTTFELKSNFSVKLLKYAIQIYQY